MPRQHGPRWTTLPDGSRTRNPHAVGATAAAEATASYGSLLKDELVALAEGRGLDSSGTKADIIARLEEDDAA